LGHFYCSLKTIRRVRSLERKFNQTSLKKSSSLTFDDKKENPGVLNRRLIDGMEIMKENYELKLKKQEQMYKDQIEGQAKQILRLKEEIKKLSLNN
jgi:hypothetical protein